MRSGRLERLLKLTQALQAGASSTVEELARAAGVSRRTVFRDLQLLEKAGIPYRYDRDAKRYSAEKTALLPPVPMSPAEAMSVLMAMHHLLDTPLATDPAAARSAALKIQSVLPSAIVDYCGRLLKRTYVRPARTSDPAAIATVLPELHQVLAARNKVSIKYDSYFERRVIEAVLRPYHLAYVHRGWYLIAFNESAGRVLTFKVDRILQLKLLASGFRPDPAFSLEEYFGDAWMMIRGDKRYHVRIRFAKRVANNVDEIVWHKTQRTEHLRDGSLLFEVDVDGIDEISWWVLGYGDRAEVLAPPELRAMIAEHARELCRIYDGEST